MSKNVILNYLGIFLLAIILLGTGFYFGYKTAQNKGEDYKISNNLVEDAAKKIQSSQSSLPTKDIEGVFWIKVGQSPICPVEYLIKGKFGSGVNFYYTKDSKQFDRVKADICFLNEDTARDKAGFVRKF